MTAVWYIGGADTRSISTTEWQSAGITGTPAPAVWNSANGWSLPAASFTAPQLALLAADGSFNTTATDGPRPGSGIVPLTPDQQPLTRGYLKTMFGTPLLEDDILAVDPVGNFTKHGNQLLARTRIKTSQQQALPANASGSLWFATIEVPPCKRPIKLEWVVALQQTAVGAGGAATLLFDLTSGTPVQLSGSFAPGSNSLGTWTRYFPVTWSYDIGPQSGWTCYQLQGGYYQDAAAGTVNVRNSSLGGETILRAVA